jgi:hypothetical protein
MTVLALPEVWKFWRVKIQMDNKILGSLPKNPSDIERFATAVGATDPSLAEKVIEEVVADPLAEVGSSCFKRDESGLYIEDRQVKALLKESATMLGYTLRNNPGRQFFQHGLFVDPPRMHLGKHEPDGVERLFGTVMTPQGPRSIVRNMDYVERPVIEFQIKGLMSDKKKEGSACPLTDDQLAIMLSHAQANGLGACRSQGFGKFTVLEFESF